MKTILVFIYAFGVATAASKFIRGGRILNRLDNQDPLDNVCVPGDMGMKCSNCSSGVVCSGATQIGHYNCPSPDNYCGHTNACTSVKPAACAPLPNTRLICSDEGFFPDPWNCQTYYFCDSDKIPFLYECPEEFVYDALNGHCGRYSAEEDCVTMLCTAENENSFIVHAANPSFYAFCDSTLTPHMFRCPQNQQFNGGCK